MGHEFGSFLDTICKLSSADPWSILLVAWNSSDSLRRVWIRDQGSSWSLWV